MERTSAGAVEWIPAPADHFTGEVWFGPLAPARDSDDISVLGVRFAAGSRTDWHSHPGGQVLYVVSGRGLVANHGGERVEVVAGDTVTTPADELHWHGASADSEMVHLSITHHGETAWSEEKVSQAQYRGQA